MAGRRDGETAEKAFERRELPRGPVTGDPVLVDGRDGRERREECRERGVEMGSAGPVAGEGMAEREEEWRCAGLEGMWRWTGGGSAGGGGDMLGGGEAERASGGDFIFCLSLVLLRTPKGSFSVLTPVDRVWTAG